MSALPSSSLPAFPYGAVYFRKTNPPGADWVRDYTTAADDGHNAFRHWFLWSAVEVAPGEFDWSDYDRQLDLAADNGIRTIIAEMMTSAPEWAFRTLAHARYVRRDGTPVRSTISPSCAVGGFPGLCLDNPDALERAGQFLTTLVSRYREHPGLGGYDIWNECGYAEDTCYCPATAAAFRSWLRKRYGDLRALGQAWGRYSYAEWDDIEPPRTIEPYADVLDWLTFRQDNAYRLMRWRADLIRQLDPDHPVTAHGIAGTLTHAAPRGTDDWRAAAEVDSYGLTWGSSRHGDEPWKQLHAMDLVRSAGPGKPFWHAEAYAGPLWMQPQVAGQASATRAASRQWRTSATGTWRVSPPVPRDSSTCAGDLCSTVRCSARSAPTAWTARVRPARTWCRSLLVGRQRLSRRGFGDRGRCPPRSGSSGSPETQIFSYAQQRSTDFYARAVQGAYQGFFADNIQALLRTHRRHRFGSWCRQ